MSPETAIALEVVCAGEGLEMGQGCLFGSCCARGEGDQQALHDDAGSAKQEIAQVVQPPEVEMALFLPPACRELRR